MSISNPDSRLDPPDDPRDAHVERLNTLVATFALCADCYAAGDDDQLKAASAILDDMRNLLDQMLGVEPADEPGAGVPTESQEWANQIASMGRTSAQRARESVTACK